MKYLITTFKDLSQPNGFTNNVLMDVTNINKYDKDAKVIISCKRANRYPNINYITSSSNIILFLKCILKIFTTDILWINSYAIHYNALLTLFAFKTIVYRAQDPVAYMYKIKHKHSKIKRDIFYRIAYVCERIVIKRSNYILTVNDEMSKLLRLNKKKVFVIYNLAGIRKLSSNPPHKKSDLKLGYLGVVQRNIRGLEYQLQLFNEHIKNGSLITQFKLLANDSENELKYIKEMIKRLDIKCVDIINAPISDEKFNQIINEIDIVILEQTPIHLPSKFFEYIYTGKIIMINESATSMKKILDEHNYYYITLKFDIKKDLDTIKRFEEEYKDGLWMNIAENCIKGKHIVDLFYDHNINNYQRLINELNK